VTILRELRELGIPEADELIIPLLEREELDPTVRREVIETLAELGTEKSARRVFELSLETDDPRLAREAASRLLRSDPPVALYLLQYLEDEDEARRVAAYDAIAKIAQVRNTRRGDFWQTASEDQKKQAIDHLRKEAGERVQRWEERQRR
jgi:HEAT repeat protein